MTATHPPLLHGQVPLETCPAHRRGHPTLSTSGKVKASTGTIPPTAIHAPALAPHFPPRLGHFLLWGATAFTPLLCLSGCSGSPWHPMGDTVTTGKQDHSISRDQSPATALTTSLPSAHSTQLPLPKLFLLPETSSTLCPCCT